MFSKLDDVESRFEQIGMQLQNPAITENQNQYRALMKEYSGLEKIVSSYREYKKIIHDIDSNHQLLDSEKDEELRSLIKEELIILESQRDQLNEDLKILLLPKDPNDEKNIILEIRPAAGGDEAALFTDELFRAYSKYALNQGWKVELMSVTPGNVGGMKEVVAGITGEKVFSKLKYESGVHRVQRVPKTEAQGRVHTSTVTVAVLPEAEEVEVKINQNDLKIDVCRSSGAGGQHVNTTDSAVRITHLPSGIVIFCQEGRSQHSNRDRAMKILYSRLLAQQEEKSIREASEARLAQIGTGDRSERIRTYNFPQSRITDHRIGLTIHSINEVMNGTFENIIDPLITHYQAEALKNQKASS